jgi:hypothetical protein
VDELAALFECHVRLSAAEAEEEYLALENLPDAPALRTGPSRIDRLREALGLPKDIPLAQVLEAAIKRSVCWVPGNKPTTFGWYLTCARSIEGAPYIMQEAWFNETNGWFVGSPGQCRPYGLADRIEWYAKLPKAPEVL